MVGPEGGEGEGGVGRSRGGGKGRGEGEEGERKKGRMLKGGKGEGKEKKGQNKYEDYSSSDEPCGSFLSGGLLCLLLDMVDNIVQYRKQTISPP